MNGHFNITSSEGSDFISSFTVDSGGSISKTFIQSHGRHFTADPSLFDIYYAGSSVKQVLQNMSKDMLVSLNTLLITLMTRILFPLCRPTRSLRSASRSLGLAM